MQIIDIIWLQEIIDKIRWKHNVTQEEAEGVLFEKPLYRKVQKGHVVGEDLYSALGQTKSGRYLIVFFIYKLNSKALILSARDMDDKEKKRYEKR